MPNIVLERLHEERARQVSFVDELLTRVDADGRDLVDAERSNLDSARERITELDAQIEPLAAFEAMRTDHAAETRGLPAPGHAVATDRRALGSTSAPDYATPGSFLVDLIRARGYGGVDPDAQAQARIAATHQRANQLTSDTPGLLPVPTVGQVLNDIDASRPFISSIGARSMAGIPGLKFLRPRISQHVDVGLQNAEKTALNSRALKVVSVEFTKQTAGGYVNISRQDIDWTSPSAWDALVQDLQDVYGNFTEGLASDAFAASAVAGPTVADNTMEGWATALYAGAAQSYGLAGHLPDTVWVSLDVWAAMGPVVDQNRLVFSGNLESSSNLSSFTGAVLNLPRVVVPEFDAGTCIIGSSKGYEFYEERIGLLSAVEPSILGVEVAYGGYVAYGAVEASHVALTAPAAPLGASGSSAKKSTK